MRAVAKNARCVVFDPDTPRKNDSKELTEKQCRCKNTNGFLKKMLYYYPRPERPRRRR